MKSLPFFIPVLTTEAGNCLTMANWQEIGIQAVSCYLESLLLKPGISLLENLLNLKSYIPWQGFLILNAALRLANKQGDYVIRSPFDGSILRIAKEDIYSLIEKLQPDAVILPSDFDARRLASLAKATKTFVVPEINSDEHFGWYLSYEQSTSFTALQTKIERYNTKPIYLTGDFDLEQLKALAQYESLMVESNLPSQLAFSGKVYGGGEVLDLLAEEMTHQHVVIDSNCGCPTCQQQFTRAYLHHLINHTPLLCQRFLIQHNGYYCQNYS